MKNLLCVVALLLLSGPSYAQCLNCGTTQSVSVVETQTNLLGQTITKSSFGSNGSAVSYGSSGTKLSLGSSGTAVVRREVLAVSARPRLLSRRSAALSSRRTFAANDVTQHLINDHGISAARVYSMTLRQRAILHDQLHGG